MRWRLHWRCRHHSGSTVARRPELRSDSARPLKRWLPRSYRELAPIVRAFADEDNYSRLGEIQVPCTILYGLSDKTTPALHSEQLHQDIAGSRIVPVPGAGHLVNWEAPEATAAAIRAAVPAAAELLVA